MIISVVQGVRKLFVTSTITLFYTYESVKICKETTSKIDLNLEIEGQIFFTASYFTFHEVKNCFLGKEMFNFH